MNIGNAIKEFRKKRNQTQIELADQCSITQTYLSQIESNKKEPNLSTLKTISEKLDVPIAVLFFMGMEETDVKPSKKKAFNTISSSLKDLVDDTFGI